MGFDVELLDDTNLPLTKNLHDPMKLIKRESKVELWKVSFAAK